MMRTASARRVVAVGVLLFVVSLASLLIGAFDEQNVVALAVSVAAIVVAAVLIIAGMRRGRGGDDCGR